MKHNLKPDNIKVINKYHIPENNKLPNKTYIGRGSIFGNPYSHLNTISLFEKYRCKTREEAISKYELYLSEQFKSDTRLSNSILDLVEKYIKGEELNLVCFCKPKACHGELIKQLIINISNELLIGSK